jgi:hypothetical protein
LDPDPTVAFAAIIRTAQAVFEHVVVEIDTTPARAMLRIQAWYGPYRVFITELIDAHTRKYRYYVLHGNDVEAGFDNSPDPRALRLKYGRIGKPTRENRFRTCIEPTKPTSSSRKRSPAPTLWTGCITTCRWAIPPTDAYTASKHLVSRPGFQITSANAFLVFMNQA